MKIKSRHFGEVEIDEKQILLFPEGLLGFANFKRYALIEDPKEPNFIWMQSLDDPNLCFVLMDPLLFMADYKVKVYPSDINSLDLKDLKDAWILVILVIRSEPLRITANLKGPIVINKQKQLAKQIVLMEEEYPTRYLLVGEENRPEVPPEPKRGGT